MKLLWSRWRGTAAPANLLRSAVAAESGSVAIIFVLAMIPILAMVGAAVDYSRSTAARTQLLAALDSAILAAAVATGTDADRQTAFQQMFNSHYLADDVQGRAATLDLTVPGVVKGVASARVTPMVMKVVGVTDIPISVTSAGRIPTAVEIMMVLDVSGSMKYPDMSGRPRIDVLKEAASSLVDTAIASAPRATALKFGYVPFTMNVNIGASNSTYVDDTNDPLFAGTTWAGCVLERAAPNHLSNTYSAATKWRAYIYPPETNQNACDNPSNGTNAGYLTVDPNVPGNYSPYTHGPNYNCIRHPVAPLSTDAAGVKAKIASLTAEYNMGTILAPGVTWGTRLLTPNAPFPGADPYGTMTHKVMVMLTDGAQTTEMRYSSCNATQNSTATPYTFDPSTFGLGGRVVGPMGPRDFYGPYGYIYDSDPFGVGYASYADVDASLDPLALSSCAYAKSLGIEVYSIAVSSYAGPGTSVYNTLQSCASDPKHFFVASDEAALKTAFATIGRNAMQFVRTK